MKRLISLIIILSFTMISPAQSPEDGKRAIAHQQYKRAENIFHDLLKTDPANAGTWFLLTRAYLLQGKSEKATDSLALSPSSIANDPDYLVARGSIYLNRNMLQQARADFDQALQKTKSKDPAIMLHIADMNIDLDRGDVGYAIELLQKAIKKDKKNATLPVSLGRAYRKIHNGTEAYKSFVDALDKDKQTAPAYYELGDLFLSQKNQDMYVDYFSKAIEADKNFAPAYYSLYNHFIFKDVSKALSYFNRYAALSEPTVAIEYAYTDLLYLNRRYDSAVIFAKSLLQKEADSVQPRIYKLIAYSLAANGDTIDALGYMRDYFQHEKDSNLVVKDFETMGHFYMASSGKEDSAITYLEKAALLAGDADTRNEYYKKLAGLSKKINDPALEAKWLGKYYQNDSLAGNVTLFNWGIAAYKANDYRQADSVFAMYASKYPEQGYGYYWRARSNAAIDTSMELGLAVSHYQKLTEVINKDSLSTSDKKWLVEAYGYLAGYEANTKKDYAEAVDYFEKLLEIDPANDKAKKYIEILEKNIGNSGSK